MTMRFTALSAIVALVGAFEFSGVCSAQQPPSLYIGGYAGQLSVAQGEEVSMHVSTTAAKYDIEVARLGAERVVVWKKAGVPGQVYAVPEDASAMGCRWPESIRCSASSEAIGAA